MDNGNIFFIINIDCDFIIPPLSDSFKYYTKKFLFLISSCTFHITIFILLIIFLFAVFRNSLNFLSINLFLESFILDGKILTFFSQMLVQWMLPKLVFYKFKSSHAFFLRYLLKCSIHSYYVIISIKDSVKVYF